jgi:hypothetical protein
VRDGKALVASVRGGDGNHYWFNIGAMSLRESWGNVDFWAMSIRSTRGTVVQPAGSVYKVADFPDGIATDWHFQPRGALTATKSADQVAVCLWRRSWRAARRPRGRGAARCWSASSAPTSSFWFRNTEVPY